MPNDAPGMSANFQLPRHAAFFGKICRSSAEFLEESGVHGNWIILKSRDSLACDAGPAPREGLRSNLIGGWLRSIECVAAVASRRCHMNSHRADAVRFLDIP